MAKKSTYVFDLDAFSEKLNAESDRACAVLGAALLDAKLEDLFRRRLSCFKDELLDSTRPIGTFSARIRLARALAWINDDVCHDLDIIRNIRNDFAHSFDHGLAFSDKLISARCTSLKIGQAHLDGYDILATTTTNFSVQVVRGMKAAFEPPRWRFEIAVSYIAQHLDDISAEYLEYSGADLVDEVRTLSANTRFTINATMTLGSIPVESVKS